MFRIDLHTHSHGSPDGALTAEMYKRKLLSGKLDYIAITDHDRISFAKKIREGLGEELGKRIIIGEEITTKSGELIGLFLQEKVMPGQTLRETAKAIRAQGGLVYVPHPFETVRKGVPKGALDDIADLVDIVETWNGRAVFQNKAKLARAWASTHAKAEASSSDAHGKKGWGRTFTTVSRRPKVDNLVELLKDGLQQRKTVHVGIVYPKLNRARKKVGRSA